MLDPRIYRAALVPVLLALVVVAFSLEDRPRPMTATLAPDAFEGERAFAQLQELAREHADRRPGDAGDAALAAEVAGQLRGAGFDVRREVFDGETIDGSRELETVIGERAGTSDERVVVVAHRDAAGPRAAAEMSGTAALLELARVFGAPRRTQRTLTLVSTTGGSGGAAGAARLAEQLEGPAPSPAESVVGVLVLGDLASRRAGRDLVVPWSNDLGATSLRLRRTLQSAVETETGRDPGQARALAHVARFAFPITFGEQGPLLDDGLPAVLLSATGELGPRPGARVSRQRQQELGRAALRTVTALDEGPRVQTATTADLPTSRKVLPGWAMRLLVGALIVPPLIAAVDGFARVRRRGEAAVAWLRWTLATALPFAVTGLFVVLLGLTGLVPSPVAPVPPAAVPVQGAALVAAGLVLLLGWLVLRPVGLRLTGSQRDPSSPGAAAMVLLVLCAAAIVVWAVNPYAALLLVPALHLWLFALAPEIRPSPPLAIAVVLLGLLPAALVVVGLAGALELGAQGVAWLALLLVAGGHISPLTWLMWSVLAGCAAGALLIAARGPGGRRPEDDHEAPITVRGPSTYAGPGSLGGTKSALRQ